ncbi:hypothetical protein [Breznakia pachnodae]|uniref:2'-5' RNA ligase n=1 Tax=Breznakia pachnodae TaxID=265178 RepID=A0ABU0E489_9FIRM|nr:hypothetical protein [Breznakia pachnodae]MDQ0361712.1 2'-5' RNA ligase [Breznakia pachnodae]
MGYAIVGYFDAKSTEVINSLWRSMADLEVDDYLIHSENTPHIKLLILNTIDIVNAEEILQSLVKKIMKVNIQFKTFSFYPNEKPFVCIDIVVTKQLLELQGVIREQFEDYIDEDMNIYFEQGTWKPDCQLTTEIDKKKLVTAVNYLLKQQLPFYGLLERIGLIEFYPAKQIYSYELL